MIKDIFTNLMTSLGQGAGGAVAGGVAGLMSAGRGVADAYSGLASSVRGYDTLNNYSGDVKNDMQSSFNQFADRTPEFNQEMMNRAMNPAGSQLGQQLLAQNTQNVNRNLANTMLTGQSNSYDVAALQNRATEQGIGAITGQLSGMAGQASNQFMAQKKYYSGASPSDARNIYGSGTQVIGG